MKKLSIVLTAAIMLFSASAFAGPENVSAHIKAAFQKDFFKAEEVKWKKVDEFSFAFFKINNAAVEVAYNENGEIIAMSKNIEITNLPLSISMELEKRYAGYTLSTQATELNFEGDTYYYLTATNSKRSLKLKCNASGSITVEKKTKIK